VVEANDGYDAVIAVTLGGVVQRWDPGGMAGLSSSPVWSRSTRRGGCTSDHIFAAPLVQLRRFSSSGFKANYTTDLVFIGTRYSSLCSGDAEKDNKIFAIRSDNGAVEWTFNTSNTVDMDVVWGLAQEEGSDILFVATDRVNSTQDSLWAIDVLTGTLLWSVNVGPLWTTPLLMDGRLYVSTTAGEIKAINPSTGATLWATSNGGIPIINDPRIIKTAADEVLIASVDLNGNVWVVRDDDFFGSSVWSASLPGTTAPGPLVAGLGGENIFVGGADGRVYQLDLATGAVEASRLTVAGEAMVDLAIEEDDATPRAPSLFATTDGGRILRFCQPFRTNTYPLDSDGDGVTDGVDNAPAVANPGQADSDQDGIGDVTDPPELELAQASYLIWPGVDTNDPNAQFDGDLNSNGIPNGIEFFHGSALPLTLSPVTENTTEYAKVVFRRSDDGFDAEYHVGYSFDLVNWYVAQAGVDGVVITVLDDNGLGDRITVRVPVSGTNVFFCYFTASIETP